LKVGLNWTQIVGWLANSGDRPSDRPENGASDHATPFRQLKTGFCPKLNIQGPRSEGNGAAGDSVAEVESVVSALADFRRSLLG